MRKLFIPILLMALLALSIPVLAQTDDDVTTDDPYAITMPDISETLAFIEANVQERHLPIEARELSQLVTHDEDTFGFTIPAAWVTYLEAYDNILTVYSREDLIDLFIPDYIYEADDIMFQLFTSAFLPANYVGENDALAWFAWLYQDLENVSETVYLYDRDLPMYYSPLVSDFAPDGAFLIVAQTGDSLAEIVVILGLTGDFEQNEATIIAIIQSMGYITEEAEATPEAAGD